MSTRGDRPVLVVKKLRKEYGRYVAVDDISFEIPRGSIIGFLGPNGAGKTTTIQMLTGITTPTGGSIRYFGQLFTDHKVASLQRISTVSAFNTLLGRITVRENLMVYGHLYQVKKLQHKIDELLGYFDITQTANELYMYLSAGQKTRVNLVKSLLHDPELILMDEPTASLDPDIADKTLTLIENMQRDRGLSILFTSHNMDEVARLCDSVIFVHKGSIVLEGKPEDLVRTIPEVTVSVTYTGDRMAIQDYLTQHGISHIFHPHHRFDMHITHDSVAAQIHDLAEVTTSITDIDIHKPTLEHVFINIARQKVSSV